MSADRAEPMILAIGSHNTFLHVYDNERELLADDDIGSGVGETRFPLEFFNSDGYRLAGVYDGHWRLLQLMPTTDKAQPKTILQRVQQVVRHLRRSVTSHPEEVALYGLTEAEALELLPQPDEWNDLDTALFAFVGKGARSSHAAVTGLGDNDYGDWSHNAAHIWGNPHRT